LDDLDAAKQEPNGPFVNNKQAVNDGGAHMNSDGDDVVVVTYANDDCDSSCDDANVGDGVAVVVLSENVADVDGGSDGELVVVDDAGDVGVGVVGGDVGFGDVVQLFCLSHHHLLYRNRGHVDFELYCVYCC
jgi:hypothetical protein